MEQTTLLKNYSDMEKGAYLGAIASLATADHAATQEEVDYIMELGDAAELSEQQKQAVARAATEISGEELNRCLDILKTSELRFSLIADLISFAEADNHYSPEEKANIENIAKALNINQEQFSLLDQFVEKVNEAPVPPAEMEKQGFLSGLGLEEKFKKSGINFSSLTKGLLGIAGPMLLANLVSKGLGGGRRSGLGGGGALGGGLGGALGGLLGGGRGGGLGSLIGGLSGGRGFSNTGGLLSRILGRR